MAEYGHVKMSRKAYAEHPFWNEPREFSKWEAWEWMIQAAAWRDHKRVVGMTVVELRRGEFLGSVRFLAEAWGWKRSRVHDFVRLLLEMGQIAGQRETHAGTVYMLVNYDTYQSSPGDSGTDARTPERTAERTGSGHRADTKRTRSGQREGSKEGKEVKEGERARRARSLPGDWAPNEQHEAIAEERGVDLHAEAEKMRDWAAAEGASKRDWDATFRNWLRRADPPRNGSHATSSQPAPGQPIPVNWTDEQLAAWRAPR